jgi:hypothetical protein
MSSETPRPARAICGRVSAVCAFVAVLAPFVIGIVYLWTEQARPAPPAEGPQAQWEGWAWLGRMLVAFVFAVAACGLTAMAGTVSGIIAVAREERPLWPAWFGLCVCSPIALLVIVGLLRAYQ